VWRARSIPRAVLSVTLDRMTPSYRLGRRHRERYQVPDGSQGNIFLVPAPLVATADTTLYHLRAQWDHPPRSTATHAGQKRRSAIVKWDSLAALNKNSGTLEMSDPLPLLLSDESEIVQARSDTARPGRPYPLDRVQRGMPVALYFEVCHLGIGSNDRTRYTVEYEVYRETERGGPARLFEGDQEQRTATEATYESRDRTAREYVLLDLKKVPLGRSGETTVTVRVTDEVTGQQVERAVGFAAVE